ncbi:MAG: hypothetical protein U9Q22_04475 [Candidatus Altiarchaeota archaeon]|nr:hypothetical protein [Candidatus Altiarchaeota archaeon]
MSSSEREYELSWLSTAISEQLVRTAGIPYNWTKDPDNITVFGLADFETIGNTTTVLSRVVDPDKLLHFINLTQDNYPVVRGKLMGSGEYDFYAVILCLNSSNRACFEGLYVDTIENGTITCFNGFNFTVRNHTTVFDYYIWIEAEDFGDLGGWGATPCVPPSDCSNGALLEGKKNDINASTLVNLSTYGLYNVWVRYYDFGGAPADTGEFRLVMNGVDSRVLGHDSVDNYLWDNPGSVSGSSANLTLYAMGAGANGADVDAILLTTNLGYVPPTTVPLCGYYGCETTEVMTRCIIGNYAPLHDITYLVHDVKTATFSEASDGGVEGDMHFLEPTVRILLVVYST